MEEKSKHNELSLFSRLGNQIVSKGFSVMNMMWKRQAMRYFFTLKPVAFIRLQVSFPF